MKRKACCPARTHRCGRPEETTRWFSDISETYGAGAAGRILRCAAECRSLFHPRGPENPGVARPLFMPRESPRLSAITSSSKPAIPARSTALSAASAKPYPRGDKSSAQQATSIRTISRSASTASVSRGTRSQELQKLQTGLEQLTAQRKDLQPLASDARKAPLKESTKMTCSRRQ